jgi:hypothetical protein
MLPEPPRPLQVVGGELDQLERHGPTLLNPKADGVLGAHR